MTAFNVVRFRVKPGHEQRFVEAHRTARPQFKGFLGGSLVQTGDQTFCLVGEWRNFQSIVSARPQMITLLDSLRDMLEDLGGGLGVTDPVSGDAVVKLAAPKAAKKRKAPARAKTKRAAGKRKAAKSRTTKRAARKR
jgi:antibiotic biosynthesis monooxygenase